MFDDFLFDDFPKIQIKRITRSQYTNITKNLSLLDQYRHVLAFAGFYIPEIVGQHALEKGKTIRPCELKQAAVTTVD